jgi:YggT family protein
VIIFINALLSWVRPDPHNPIVMFLDRVSDLICDPIRRLFPTAVSGIDFAPFIAMLALWFIKMFLVQTLHDVAVRMR